MNRTQFSFILVLVTVSIASAAPSLQFSTKSNTGTTWTLTKSTPGKFILSFTTDGMEVDETNPTPDPVMQDIVNISSMTLGNISDNGGFATGQLTSTGNLTIKSDIFPFANVFTASIKNGAMVTYTSNFIAFDNYQDDLDVLYVQPGYSPILDAFQAGDIGLDWSFSGTSEAPANIYAFVTGADQSNRCICGTIDGQINTLIPAPGAVTLVSVGLLFVGWTRHRHKM